MPTSSSTTTHDGDTFVCACDKDWITACRSEGFYKKHDDKQYCVLHYPSTKKKEAFAKALQRKLNDNDFDFRGVWFPDEVDFSGRTFSAVADFSGARFSADANFSKAQFNATVSFWDAKFKADDSFRSQGLISANKTSGTDDSVATEFKSIKVKFNEATFKDGVRFNWNVFADRVFLSFADAIFEKPERAVFHTTPLRPHWFINVDSRKFTFIDVDWGALNKWDAIRRETKALQSSGHEHLRRLLEITFRQLAVNAEENNRYEEAADFRYMAMEAKRLQRGRKVDLFRLSWWYWLLSGYGERVTRAFGALLVIWLLFAVIYSAGNATWWQAKQSSRVAAESGAREQQPSGVAEKPQAVASAPLTVPEAVIYSAGVMSLQKPEPLPANKCAKAFVLFETILGPLQAALLALAIRRKFMR